MALIARPAGSSTPSKITLSNMKIIKIFHSILESNNHLNYYAPDMRENFRKQYVYHLTFNDDALYPFDPPLKAAMSYANLDSVSVTSVTDNAPVTREYFRSLDLGS